MKLDEELDSIWHMLETAGRSGIEAFRTPVLCTSREGGGDGRVVILRKVDRQSARLWFHSDVRAPKVRQCTAPVALVFWDSQQNVQLRARGAACAHSSDRHAADCWADTGSHSRENYRGNCAPGTRVAEFSECARLAAHNGRENFCTIEVAITELDLLRLSEGRRMVAKLESTQWSLTWVHL